MLIFQDIKIVWIVVIFLFAAFTDFLDGFIARRYNQVTDFGRRLDMIADRILMVSTIMAIISYLSINSLLSNEKIILMLLMVSREIISAPFLMIALVLKKRIIPHARFLGKLMTVMQGITFPLIVIGWRIAMPITIFTCIIGIITSGYFIYDSVINPNNKFQTDLDKKYAAGIVSRKINTPGKKQ